MSQDSSDIERRRLAWRSPPAGRVIGRGHPAGDFLEAFDWQLEEERPGYLRLRIELPDHLRNPRGQLFGGFAPTYVDLAALLALRAGTDRGQNPGWLATTSMRIEYLLPVLGPTFRLESHVVHRRKRANLVETRFLDLDDTLLVLAHTNMLEVRQAGRLGDG